MICSRYLCLFGAFGKGMGLLWRGAHLMCAGDTAIVRLEQLYPTPVEEMKKAIEQFPGAQLRWVQDEPANQGPWSYMGLFMPRYGINFQVISRPASASPATGSAKRHAAEQADLIARAFGD